MSPLTQRLNYRSACDIHRCLTLVPHPTTSIYSVNQKKINPLIFSDIFSKTVAKF